MFKKKAKSIDPNSTDTLLGEGTQFEGNLNSEASIRIEGGIVGDIDCKGDVTIGDNGNAQSSITARNVIIAGKVKGNVNAVEKLTITPTGQLHGNAISKKLIIDDGGIFMGNSQMHTSPSTASNTANSANSGNNMNQMQSGSSGSGGSSVSASIGSSSQSNQHGQHNQSHGSARAQ